MQLIYLHGLDSDSNAEKGKLLADYCQKYFPQITVVRPDLNLSPPQVVEKVTALIAQDPNTGLVGSSLGGFFANYLANQTGVKAVILNPSTDPATSFGRFLPEGVDFDSVADDYVGHVTAGGWAITKADGLWFQANRPAFAKYPQNLLILLKEGDELLDYKQAVAYFSQTQAGQNGQSHLIIEPDGDHRMTDFDTKLPQVVQFLFGLAEK